MNVRHAGMLGGEELDAHPFPPEQCAALFAAVLVDDVVDRETPLPASIPLDHPRERLIDCFRLCRQLWLSGFDAGALVDLSSKLARERGLNQEDALRFKHMRAKFKHLRYAHALYGEAHRYPPLLDRITIVMGHAQDGARNGRRSAVLRDALLLRLLLTLPSRHMLRAETDRFSPATSEAFRDLLRRDVAAFETVLSEATVTARRLHTIRKIVGRQVSFWDTLRTLEPTEERYRISRALSAINGLMGALHDDLIVEKGEDARAYEERAFPIPAAIRDRLTDLTERYRC